MSKIIFLFIVVVSIGFISGSKKHAQIEMAEKYAKPAILKDFTGGTKIDIGESKVDSESFTPKKAPDGSPGILLILNNDTGLPIWSPSFWWGYQHANTRKTGC